MTFLFQFFQVFAGYVRELWWILALGFFLSGLCVKFVPAKVVEEHLGGKGIRPIFLSTIVGTILPVCCIGALPIALTLKCKGASLGATLAFLVATPATSLSALFVCWKLLGFMFTVVIFFAVILMGLAIGFICNAIKFEPIATKLRQQEDSCEDPLSPQQLSQISPVQKIRGALRYGFITLPREIGAEILFGIAIASVISASESIRHLIQQYLTGFMGYAATLIVGLLDYVCATASVPLADVLVESGMSYGQVLVYLLVGPITSYGTILVIKKQFGGCVLGLYLAVISVLSLLFGLLLDLFV